MHMYIFIAGPQTDKFEIARQCGYPGTHPMSAPPVTNEHKAGGMLLATSTLSRTLQVQQAS